MTVARTDLSTFAGGQVDLGDGGPATQAALYYPYDVVIDAASNVYIADTHHYRVRRVDAATGIIETLAGSGVPGSGGDGGPANAAELQPDGLCLVGRRLFICDMTSNRDRPGPALSQRHGHR